MTFDKMNSAGYLANHMARLFAQGLHKRIKPLGIAPAQFAALLELWEEDGLTQNMLTERLDIEQATMANTITRMERDGLVGRRRHPKDKRIKTVHLTGRARAIRSEAIKAAGLQNDLALAGLSDGERKKFLVMMRKVISGMKTPDTL